MLGGVSPRSRDERHWWGWVTVTYHGQGVIKNPSAGRNVVEQDSYIE